MNTQKRLNRASVNRQRFIAQTQARAIHIPAKAISVPLYEAGVFMFCGQTIVRCPNCESCMKNEDLKLRPGAPFTASFMDNLC
jgi:hypothetical protein